MVAKTDMGGPKLIRAHADEQHIALLYPNADFIFVANSEKRLKQRLEKGIKIAMENGDFDTYFDKHYMTVLQKYNFFNRKLLFLKNKDISEQALRAINVYGLASFSNQSRTWYYLPWFELINSIPVATLPSSIRCSKLSCLLTFMSGLMVGRYSPSSSTIYPVVIAN